VKQPLMPYRITRRDDGLLLEWDQAGHTALYAARWLRLSCPCAECVEEMSGRPLLQPELVAPDVRPVSIGLVGSYGLKVSWSDGHGTGIYTFEKLLASCPCEACREVRGEG
jgi:ATP-binding protein involved in chromosome partitioning